MTLRQLETLRSLRRAGSLSAAARELGLSQPAVSMQMRDLTREVGVPLFRTEGRRIVLAPAGIELASYAERVLALAAEGAEAARVAHREGGLVRVAASSTPGVSLLPPLLASYRRRHPRVAVRLRVANTAEVEAWVHDGEADVGIVGGPISATDLEVEDWQEDELVLVVAPDHRLARRRRIPATDLAGETLLAREQGSATRTTVEATFLTAGAPLPPQHVVGDSEAIKRAVAAGLGIAILSRFTVADEVRSGELRALRVVGVPLQRPLRILVRKGASQPPPVASFLRALRASARPVRRSRRGPK